MVNKLASPQSWEVCLLFLGCFTAAVVDAGFTPEPQPPPCGAGEEPKCCHSLRCIGLSYGILFGLAFGVICLFALMAYALGCCAPAVIKCIRLGRNPTTTLPIALTHRASSISPSDSVSSIRERPVQEASSGGNIGHGAPHSADRSLAAEKPLSGRYIGQCESPGSRHSFTYYLKFEEDGRVSGTCAAVESVPLEVSGRYDSGAQLYRWIQVTSSALLREHEGSARKDYKEPLLESGLFWIEVEVRVHSKEELHGYYVTANGTHGTVVLKAQTQEVSRLYNVFD